MVLTIRRGAWPRGPQAHGVTRMALWWPATRTPAENAHEECYQEMAHVNDAAMDDEARERALVQVAARLGVTLVFVGEGGT
jgi:hypothetical protein